MPSLSAKILLVVLLLIVIGGAAVLYIWLRRQRQEGGPAPAKKIGRRRLLGAWREFLRPLPLSSRRSVRRFPQVVVLGDAGAGKSKLIEVQVDWQGQAKQFFPSYIDDPLLQIYLGGRVVVQEISSALLADTSNSARAALWNLWRRLFCLQAPTVLLVLSGEALAAMTPDQARRQAQLMRGKINLLSQVYRTAIKTRVCVTHMDTVEGYQDLARLLHQHKIPLEIDLHQPADDDRLDVTLAPYGKHLPLALTALPADAFRRVVLFFGQAPELLGPVSNFLGALLRSDQLWLTPRMEKLYLFSPAQAEQVGQPFDVQQPPPLSELRRKNRTRHLLRCAVMLLCGIVPLCAIYGYHRRLLRDAEESVGRFAAAAEDAQWQAAATAAAVSGPAGAAAQEAEQKMDALTTSEGLWPLLPRSYGREKRAMKEDMAEAIRQFYLLPLLGRYTAQNQRERALYTLALLYASRKSVLGAVLRAQGREWVINQDLPPGLSDRYLNASDVPWRSPVPPNLLSFPAERQLTPATHIQPWLSFLAELERLYDSGEVTRAQLSQLQQQGGPLLDALDEVRRFQTTQEIFHALAAQSPVPMERVFGSATIALNTPPWVLDNAQHLRGLLLLLKNGGLDYPAPERLGLHQLLTTLKEMEPLDKSPDEVFRLTLSPQHTLLFHTKAWAALLLRSRQRRLIESFISVHLHAGRWPFFSVLGGQAGDEPPPSGWLPESLTKDALEREVKPALKDFDLLLSEAHLSPRDEAALASYVRYESRGYMRQYYEALVSYYRKGYGLQIDSTEALAAVLPQLGEPSSPLVDYLRTVADNSSIAGLEGPYLQPLAESLSAFKPISALMVHKDNAYPELAKYTALLGQLAKDVTSEAVPAAGDKAPGLAELVSPAGRAALGMWLEQDTSYLQKVDQFLDKAGIHGDWRRPFREPILLAFKLGMSDVERTLAQRWDQEREQVLDPLLLRFPFNPRAEREVEIGELEVLRWPDGALWRTFRQVFLPLCVEREREWVQRRSSLGPLRLPVGMLALTNHLGRSARLLWDKDGNQQALPLSVQPLPLGAVPGEPQSVVLSYVKAGKVTVYGFNQQPSWQPFALTWWSQEVAGVGVQESAAGSSAKQYHSIEVSNSPWSFHRLLGQGRINDRGVVTWIVPGDGGRLQEREVRFGLRGDPFAPFRVQVE